MLTLLLDRDGTIIKDVGEDRVDLAKIALLPGAAEGLKRFQDAGAELFIVTNQSSIGRGTHTSQQFERANDHMRALLREKGIVITASRHCPHLPEEHCPCRKPKTGMWDQLRADFPQLDPKTTVMVGDKDSDVLFGNAIGCETARIDSKQHPKEVEADYVVKNLSELADLLLRKGAVVSLKEAADMAKVVRASGKKIVTTNGAFDLFHEGHRFLLSQARLHGDFLIVGVNSDASVKKQKGSDRPRQPQDTRARKVAEYADSVFIFDDDDPRPWLPLIRPHVHVNAETYGKECVEAEVLREIGARLVLVPVLPELGSTTANLQRSSRKSS